MEENKLKENNFPIEATVIQDKTTEYVDSLGNKFMVPGGFKALPELATTDNPCNIYDMKGNLIEWTTEYSSNKSYGVHYSCVTRGGTYSNDFSYPAYRTKWNAITSGAKTIGFRAVLNIL